MAQMELTALIAKPGPKVGRVNRAMMTLVRLAIRARRIRVVKVPKHTKNA